MNSSAIGIDTLLAQLIGKSRAIQTKLDEGQREEFVQKVVAMPPEGKIKMLQALMDEVSTIAAQDAEAERVVNDVRAFLAGEFAKADKDINQG